MNRLVETSGPGEDPGDAVIRHRGAGIDREGRPPERRRVVPDLRLPPCADAERAENREVPNGGGRDAGTRPDTAATGGVSHTTAMKMPSIGT